MCYSTLLKLIYFFDMVIKETTTTTKVDVSSHDEIIVPLQVIFVTR
jgi:hypothetical protein